MRNLKVFSNFISEAVELPKDGNYLLFNGNKLDFVSGGKVVKSWTACSGRTYYHLHIAPDIWRRRYTMKPEEWSKVKNQGPTPPGKYTLGSTEKRSIPDKWKTDAEYVKGVATKTTVTDLPGSGYKFNEPHEFSDRTDSSYVPWGDWRWALIPDKSTETFGRTSFYLHGGSTPGSIGCIDLVTDSGEFGKYYDEWRKKNKKSTIPLIVDYTTYNKNAPIDVATQPFKIPLPKDNEDWYAKTNAILRDTTIKNKIPVSTDLIAARGNARAALALELKKKWEEDNNKNFNTTKKTSVRMYRTDRSTKKMVDAGPKEVTANDLIVRGSTVKSIELESNGFLRINFKGEFPSYMIVSPYAVQYG